MMATGPCRDTLGAGRIAMIQVEDRSLATVVAVAFMLVLEVVFVLGLGALVISHLL